MRCLPPLNDELFLQICDSETELNIQNFANRLEKDVKFESGLNNLLLHECKFPNLKILFRVVQLADFIIRFSGSDF